MNSLRIISGKYGTGKTYFVKEELSKRFYGNNNERSIVLSFTDEYSDFIEMMGAFNYYVPYGCDVSEIKCLDYLMDTFIEPKIRFLNINIDTNISAFGYSKLIKTLMKDMKSVNDKICCHLYIEEFQRFSDYPSFSLKEVLNLLGEQPDNNMSITVLSQVQSDPIELIELMQEYGKPYVRLQFIGK